MQIAVLMENSRHGTYPVEESGHGDEAGGLGDGQALEDHLSRGHDRAGIAYWENPQIERMQIE